jgi:hypothetical protein
MFNLISFLSFIEENSLAIVGRPDAILVLDAKIVIIPSGFECMQTRISIIFN